MKILSPCFIMLALTCCLLACSTAKNSDPPKSVLIGDYQYTSYDKQGGKVVEGRLSITSVESKRVRSETVIQLKGNWQLNKVGTQEYIGPQVGSGDLVGSIDKDEIWIDLDPNISDANVFLNGKVEGKRFHGTWSFKGYAGTINQGTFEATRK